LREGGSDKVSKMIPECKNTVARKGESKKSKLRRGPGVKLFENDEGSRGEKADARGQETGRGNGVKREHG